MYTNPGDAVFESLCGSDVTILAFPLNLILIHFLQSTQCGFDFDLDYSLGNYIGGSAEC